MENLIEEQKQVEHFLEVNIPRLTNLKTFITTDDFKKLSKLSQRRMILQAHYLENVVSNMVQYNEILKEGIHEAR